MMKNNKVLISTYVCNTLEVYDFILGGVLIPYISHLFFPMDNKFLVLLAGSLTFLIGFVLRPIGGIFFGYIGDIFGRKKALLGSIFGMAIATLLTGLLPTYETISIFAPISLVILRMIQGFCLGGEGQGANVFVMDELPALQRLPSLKTGLAELRKYGGCILAGLQSIPQLEEIYGRAASQNMLNLFNTFLFFRNNDPTTSQWISKVLGEREQQEIQENLSYGAHAMRDGVSLNPTSKTTPLVLPTEIGSLQDLEAYLKLPGSWPITKLKVRYKSIRNITDPYERVLCMENKNQISISSPTKKVPQKRRRKYQQEIA